MAAKLQLISGHNFFFAEYTVLYTLYKIRQASKSLLIRKVTDVAINISMACPDWGKKGGLTVGDYSRVN